MKIVIFKFKVFDKRIKRKAMKVAREFQGVTEAKEVEGEGQLEVRGEFDTFELTKKLRKIDETVDTIKVGSDEETVPEVKNQQPDEPSKPLNDDDASSSNWAGVQPYDLLGKAKGFGAGAAGKAIDISAGAVGMAKDIAVGAYNLLPSNNQNKGKEVKAEAEPKRRVGGKTWGQKFPVDNRGFLEKYLENRKRQNEARLRLERAREHDRKQKEQMQEMNAKYNGKGKKDASASASGTVSSTISALSTGITSMLTQRTGEPSASTTNTTNATQTQRTQGSTQRPKTESRPVEKKGKNGR